jgi:replicative DNA helicase
MQEKVIPQNITAEQSVLSALLIDQNAISVVSEILKPEDFYRIAHQVIYRAMLNLYAKNEPVDMVTVIEELRRMDKLKDVGDISYVTMLAAIVPTAANVKFHARIVENKAMQRALIESGTAIASLGYQCADDELGSAVDTVEKTLLDLSMRKRKSGRDFTPIQEIVTTTVDRLGNMVENDDSVTGLRTGFTDLDELITGLHPSDFIILAARPSMGKTALALNIAQNVALRGAAEGEAPKRVAFFSLEMSRDQLVQRMICTEADVEAQELCARKKNEADIAQSENAANVAAGTLQSGNATNAAAAAEKTQDEKMKILDRIWEASDKLASSSVYIDDTPGLSIQEMRSKARRLKADGGLDLIVIDYLQLMQAPSGRPNSDNRQHEVAEISRGLKALARELNVPVLALSQLSRSVESRQTKKPMLSDLRESGSLEQDADIVMFLYREDYYKTTDAKPVHLTELIIAKHRNGPTGKINLFFKNDCTKFISMNRRDAC